MQQRRSERTEVFLPVQYSYDGECAQAQAQIIDLTPWGMRIWTGADMPPGTHIDMEMILPIERKMLPVGGDPTSMSTGPSMPEQAHVKGEVMYHDKAPQGGYYLGIALNASALHQDHLVIKAYLEDLLRYS